MDIQATKLLVFD